MADEFYPTIDAEFLFNLIESNSKIIANSRINVDDSTAFVMKGERPIAKRLLILRQLAPNEISFENATGIAIKLGCMGDLLKWLESNKNWKDGAYCLPK